MNYSKEGWVFILERSGLGEILHEKLYAPLAEEFPSMRIMPPTLNYDLLDIDKFSLVEESTMQNALAAYILSSNLAKPVVAITHVNRPESLKAVQQLHELGVLMTVRLPDPDVNVPEVSIGASTDFFQDAKIPYFFAGSYTQWVIENTLILLRDN